jgi:fatty-acid peroxygenase
MTDLALRLVRDGYLAIEHDRRARGGGSSYVSRLLGRRAVVVSGEGGARLFYDEGMVERAGAMPPPLALLLFGRGAVHGLDGGEHRDRKQLFLDRLGAGQVVACARRAGEHLDARLKASAGQEVVVYDELVAAYGTAVVDWAGIDIPTDDAARLGRGLASIVDGFGFDGVAYPRAWQARLRTNAQLRAIVRAARAEFPAPPPGSMLDTIASSDLDEHTAAVELGNVLRPTVAVAWLGAFAVLALDRVGGWRSRLADPENEADRLTFAQEVRRTTPFVPALAGRARHEGEHDGLAIHRGDRLVLDVRGIDHDPELHPDPEHFVPDRFLHRVPGIYDLVPQGGGPVTGHRCPGESMALQLLVVTLRAFAAVDAQVVGPVAADLRRIPTLPHGGLRVGLR